MFTRSNVSSSSFAMNNRLELLLVEEPTEEVDRYIDLTTIYIQIALQLLL
jgi:hypothetical protein